MNRDKRPNDGIDTNIGTKVPNIIGSEGIGIYVSAEGTGYADDIRP